MYKTLRRVLLEDLKILESHSIGDLEAAEAANELRAFIMRNTDEEKRWEPRH